MRILIVGAGAIGGYFGGRLASAGRDVTFLVRERRMSELRRTGLVIKSPLGDTHLPDPKLALSSTLDDAYDLILLSCKAYDLDNAIASFEKAVGPATTILPVLNGMAHMDRLDARFGGERVLGGLCLISTTLDAEGRILHLNDLHTLSFGERDGGVSRRIEAIGAQFEGANAHGAVSPDIMQEMWEKWVFIASMAGITCLMRASVGTISAAGGKAFASRLLNDCVSIATANGHAPRPESVQRMLFMLTAENSPIKASMLRDIERGARTEGDHILGDLLQRSADADPHQILALCFAHVKAYEVERRARDDGKAG